MIYNIGEKSSLVNQFMSEIRDKNIQKDSLRFRRNLERMGEIFAYEISQKLTYQSQMVETPLGIAQVPVLSENILLATIMRAGMPLHQGLLNYFDKAGNAFISAYRKYHKDGSFDIKFEYLSAPATDNKTIILSDPMLATGSSMVLAYNALLGKGTPTYTHIVVLVASTDGIEYLKKHIDMTKVSVWVAAIDKELTAKSYIVPGIGDAGDLAYGDKE